MKIDERKKYIVDLGGQKSMTKHNNQPKVRGHNKGGKGDEEIRRGGGLRGKGDTIILGKIELGVGVKN
jgi:hypothetical protein